MLSQVRVIYFPLSYFCFAMSSRCDLFSVFLLLFMTCSFPGELFYLLFVPLFFLRLFRHVDVLVRGCPCGALRFLSR